MLSDISCRRNAIRECRRCRAKISRYANASVIKRGYVLPGIVVLQERYQQKSSHKDSEIKSRRSGGAEAEMRRDAVTIPRCLLSTERLPAALAWNTSWTIMSMKSSHACAVE